VIADTLPRKLEEKAPNWAGKGNLSPFKGFQQINGEL